MSANDDETRVASTPDVTPVRIDRYRLMQRLGEGGFGEVFLAEQLEPVRRQVALKVIKLGMDTREVVARFEQERQALAIMDHPHVAKVIDAGATNEGRPYFVMELVKGEPITSFCDRHRLPLRDRLALVEQVCRAVQHAHQKGLIHRDIKPSNILVSLQDGQPQPKIIDFGIAKATSARLTDRTVFTAQFQLIGTPEYMSPEQADGSLDIDTRTDIYSLGAVLYELVTGTTPFTSEDLRGTPFAEVQRMLREVEPPTASRRLSQSAATLPALADKRATDPERLSRAVRGELDWIIQKAIDKDRTRRYDTALGLALDIRRYLDGDAVLAVPPSANYRMRKFVTRHRGAAAATAVVATALVLGLIGTLWQASVASRERDSARTEAARAQAVTDFVVASLKTSDPSLQGRVDATVADAMHQAAKRLNAGDLASEPEAVALLQRTIGSVLNGTSKSTDARPFAEQSLALERKLHGNAHAHVGDALYELGAILALTGPFDAAEATLTEAVQIRRALLPSNETALLQALNELAGPKIRLSKFDEALKLGQEALAISRKVNPNGDRDTEIAVNAVAVASRGLGKLDDAERYYSEALAIARRLYPDDHPDKATLLVNIAVTRRNLGRYPEALEAANEAVAMNQRIFKGDTPTTASALMSVALNHLSLGKPEEGLASALEAIAMLRRLYPGDHPLTARSLENLSDIQLKAGKAADAQRAASEAVGMYRRVKKGNSREVVSSLQRVASAEAALKQWPAALTHAREAVDVAAQIAPAGDALRTGAEKKLADLEQRAAATRR